MFPGYADKFVLANDIGKYFASKIERIRAKIERASVNIDEFVIMTTNDYTYWDNTTIIQGTIRIWCPHLHSKVS